VSVFTNPASGSREHAAAYTAAVLNLIGSRDPLDVLTRTESAIRDEVAGVAPRQLATPEAPGKWSIAQVVQHLADSDLVWGFRVRMVLAHDRPAIGGYDQDLWATRLHYDEADMAQALRQFAVLREGNLRLIGRATPEDRQRVGLHAERGAESVDHMIRLYAGHDLLHLAQIARIRAAVTP
jgi:DinB family protein